MSRCHVCGKKETAQPVCLGCGKTYCSDHIDREKHPCFETPGRNTKRVYVGAWNHELKPAFFEEDGFDRQMNHIKQEKKKLEKPSLLNVFKSSPTLSIIIICTLIFILVHLIPTSISYMIYYPSIEYTIRMPWTLITHMFLHQSLDHLLFNMLGLFIFGSFLEKRIGPKLFTIVYILSGLGAVLGYSLFSHSFVLGASGAIYGIIATVAVLDPNMTIIVYIIPMKIKYAVILFALLDLFNGIALAGMSPIAHFAHLSGLLFGIVFGIIIRKNGWDRGRERRW